MFACQTWNTAEPLFCDQNQSGSNSVTWSKGFFPIALPISTSWNINPYQYLFENNLAFKKKMKSEEIRCKNKFLPVTQSEYYYTYITSCSSQAQVDPLHRLPALC